jgi:hypothetical protein
MKRSKNKGLIDFLTVESIEKAKINNANPKRNPKPKSYFDAFALSIYWVRIKIEERVFTKKLAVN